MTTTPDVREAVAERYALPMRLGGTEGFRGEFV